MFVILDANMIFGDFRLRRTNLRVLVESIRRTGDIVCMPEVVVDEIKNQYRESLREAWTGVRQNLSRLGRLVDVDLEHPLSEERLASESSTYSGWLDARLSNLGIRRLPYPTVDHRDLVRRDLDRRRPFSSEGRGYRDALIWESVASLVRDKTGRVAFLSANIRDFAKEGQLHADLAADLEPTERTRLRFYTDLRTFVDTEIKTTLERLESIRDELQKGKLGDFDLTFWLASDLERVLSGKRLEATDLGLKGGHVQITASLVHHVFESRVDSVTRLPSGELLIEGLAEIACEIEISMSQQDFDALPQDERPRPWSGPEQADGYGVGFRLVPLQVQFALTLGEEEGRVTSSEVATVRGASTA